MEYFDIVDESGLPTGEIVSRDIAHRDGIRHRTAHVWVVRPAHAGYDILLQKRSRNKDSFPGFFDTSSAGHIPAGIDFVPSAIRELEEELGVIAAPEELHFCGQRKIHFEEEFYGEMFRDDQVSNIYLLWRDQESFALQKEELSEVRWFDFEECVDAVQNNAIPHCIYVEELLMVNAGADESLRGLKDKSL